MSSLPEVTLPLTLEVVTCATADEIISIKAAIITYSFFCIKIIPIS